MSGTTVSIDPAEDRQQQRRAMSAVTFRESPYLEGMAEALRRFPDMELTATDRMALYLYQQEKAQAELAAQLRIQ